VILRLPLAAIDPAARVSDYDAIRLSATTDAEGLEATLVSASGKTLASQTMTSEGLWESPNQFTVLEMPSSVSESLSSTTLEVSLKGEGELSLSSVHMVSNLNGIALTAAAFASYSQMFGAIFIPIAALLFAYTTVLAGHYYGEISCHFLSERIVKPYLWLYVVATFLGCVANLGLVINFSDLALGLMCIPNLIAIVLLSGQIRSQTAEYQHLLRGRKD